MPAHNFIDLTGQRFHRLVVVEYAGKNKHRNAMWRCVCDCNGQAVATTNSLRQGTIKSCGCFRKEVAANTGRAALTGKPALNRRNLIEQVFGKLKVIGFAGVKKKQATWVCKCTCGSTTTLSSNSLLMGNSTSCGCFQVEQVTTHGMHGSAEYQAYHDAKQRCTNPVHPSWEYYGGRGIEFRFNSFEEWFAELGLRPEGVDENGRALYSVDRIDNDGPYAKGNVRWAMKEVQRQNQRPYGLAKVAREVPAAMAA